MEIMIGSPVTHFTGSQGVCVGFAKNLPDVFDVQITRPARRGWHKEGDRVLWSWGDLAPKR